MLNLNHVHVGTMLDMFTKEKRSKIVKKLNKVGYGTKAVRNAYHIVVLKISSGGYLL